MKKTILTAALLLAGHAGWAEPLKAEIVMGGNSAWRGEIKSRDGDRIEFLRTGSAQPIEVGVKSITSLNFTVKVDNDEISRLMAAREFDKVIEIVNQTLEPFAEYKDIPSNLARYEAALMELYYYAKEYDKSLELSAKLIEDDRDPAIQSKAQIFRTLALIDSGDLDGAKVLAARYGWDGETTNDTAPDRLYIKSKLLKLSGDFRPALLEAARVVAFHSQDPDWMQRAELLCAELYTELGMYDSAEEVCRQILLLYRNTPEYDEASLLLEKIEKLRDAQPAVSEET